MKEKRIKINNNIKENLNKRKNCEIKKNIGNEGITLIALAVTIVVLLIIASISIATLTRR